MHMTMCGVWYVVSSRQYFVMLYFSCFETCMTVIWLITYYSTYSKPWPSGAAARHRRRICLHNLSLLNGVSRGWSKRVLDIHTIWITYSSYRYGPWRVVINAYFSSDLVQFDRGGTTQNLGRIVPEVGADRLWGGSSVSRKL